MLNGLDLFSGIGGISIALREWVKPIAYCEIDPYCQGILLSQMARGAISKAPIWDNVVTLDGFLFKEFSMDIIYGGFPCQDISVAGRGKGLEGERSGLFFEIMRLSKEIKPRFIFLENVPAITSRGGLQVVREITEMGYDCRWCVISAASIGALHRRERWFLLAYAKHSGSHGTEERGSAEKTVPDDEKGKNEAKQPEGSDQSRMLASESISNANYPRSDTSECDHKEQSSCCQKWGNSFSRTGRCRNDVPNSSSKGLEGQGNGTQCASEKESMSSCLSSEKQILNFWENTEPPVCGIPNGIPSRLDGIDINEGSMLICSYALSTKTSPREILSLLQREDFTSSFQKWEASMQTHFLKKEILFDFLRLCMEKCEYISSKEEFLSQKSPQTPREYLRSMRNNRKSSGSSHRSELQKQRFMQSTNTLQDLSQLLAQSLEKAWKARCRENAKDRVDRIRALGNAVVPSQAKEAFKILMGLK